MTTCKECKHYRQWKKTKYGDCNSGKFNFNKSRPKKDELVVAGYDIDEINVGEDFGCIHGKKLITQTKGTTEILPEKNVKIVKIGTLND